MNKIFNGRYSLNKAIGLVLAYTLTASPVYAAQLSDIADGIAAYNKASYDTALQHFTLAEAIYPKSAFIHYYMGNTLVYLMKMPEAMAEYNLAAQLDPNHAVGNYARKAMAQHALLQHADKLSNHLLQQGEEEQNSVLAQGKKLYSDIHQNEEKDAQNMINCSYENGNIAVPVYSQADIEAYRQMQEDTADNILDTAQRDSKVVSSQASDRANAIRNSATALAQQLTDTKGSGGTKLNPLGTNLYVRNYTDTSSSR